MCKAAGISGREGTYISVVKPESGSDEKVSIFNIYPFDIFPGGSKACYYIRHM